MSKEEITIYHDNNFTIRISYILFVSVHRVILSYCFRRRKMPTAGKGEREGGGEEEAITNYEHF